MALKGINEWLSASNGNMYRPNRYHISMDRLGAKLEFFAHTINVPTNEISSIPINYNGLTFSIPGDRTVVRTISMEIWNDTEFQIYNQLTTWIESIRPNTTPGGTLNAVNAFGTCNIDLYNTDGKIIKSFLLNSVYPVTIGEIPLSFTSNDTISSFNCIFNFATMIPIPVVAAEAIA